ncbi:Uncharacterized conserved protein [Clostridium carnis]|uniref:Uncharacterized conserved protein n=1 Tax=Clostridium carnis TaxID=1530 RepID=A0ABY6SYY4_9CLOT|nr:AAA family ATPase [Clostridium carnis]VDG73503.1 Uncharacterized conserved protein [Clostridium carnis]
MINRLYIQNLKSISELEINCSNLNLFVGTNSSGKSTVLQSLLLLSQNINQNSGLNGYLTSLGEFREAKNFNVDKKEITVSVEDKDDKLEITFWEDKEGNLQSEINCNNEELKKIMSFDNNHIHYLSCHRIGALDIYNKNLSGYDEFGINGEYTMYYLMKHGSDPLEKELIKSMDSYVLLNQVNYWLKYIVNSTVKTENILGTDVLKAKYSMIDERELRPKNVGSGISYLVSLIIMCLASKKNDILIIENPEIHLHPKSQARVCEFLYFIAQSGRQLFVETHSDHLFNGLRAGIATNSMDKEQMEINFLNINNENCTENTKIQIGKRGKILNQVNDLFDQFDADLNKMLGL